MISSKTIIIVASLWGMSMSFTPHYSGTKSMTAPTTTSSRTPVAFDRLYSTVAAASATATTEIAEGVIKKVTKPGTGVAAKLGDIATIKYSCYVVGDDMSTPFSKSERQKMVIGDSAMVLGWEKAIRSMEVGERAIVRVTDPELGYGSAGVPPLIPANAELEFDIEILTTQPAMANIDFDSLAVADNTPRTAAEIQAAYEARQAVKVPEKEGLEGWIEKAKNFYFFGLFEGETGKQAPWFLRPSITFPIAFAIVGAAFWVSYATGSIFERGASVTDELDEFILDSSLPTGASPSTLLAMMMVMTNIFSSYSV